MSRYEFRPATPDDAAQVNDFNRRMAEAGSKQALSLGEPFQKIERRPDSPIRLERYFCFLDGVLRGGVAVKRMPFQVGGELVQVANLSYPVSEGVANRRFSSVGMAMMRELTRRFPLLYALGVGSMSEPIARLLVALGWKSLPVPFYFSVCRARPFLRNMQPLRNRRGNRLLMDLLAASGLGSLGLASLHAGQRLAGRFPKARGAQVEEFDQWQDWADAVWEQSREEYDLAGDRSCAALRALYPSGHPRYRKLRVSGADGSPLGWAVFSASDLQSHSFFGDLRLGALIDAFGPPGQASTLASAAVHEMKKAGADVIVVNQLAASWQHAFRKSGLLRWRSNFFLFLSPELHDLLKPLKDRSERFFIMRGDGDGPVNLW